MPCYYLQKIRILLSLITDNGFFLERQFLFRASTEAAASKWWCPMVADVSKATFDLEKGDAVTYKQKNNKRLGQ